MITAKQLFASLSILVVLATAACNDFEQIQKSKDIEFKKTKADEYYGNKKWEEANTLYEELLPVYKGKNQFETLYYRYAFTFYYQESYLAASYHFKNLTENFPNSPRRDTCEFLTALCLYKLSPESTLDQGSTIKAIAALQDYVNEHPESPNTIEANKMIDEARRKLEKKDFESAELYFKIGEFKSAAAAYGNLLKKYPESNRADLFYWRMMQSNFQYAGLSIAAKQAERYQQALVDYNDLIANYPNTQYKTEADQLKNAIFAIQKKSTTQ
ncbi:MAG: outer membrane protein assembly factor BamD [Bacteroidota bacterium]|jgi:outer membrane protein assembly factor BamD